MNWKNKGNVSEIMFKVSKKFQGFLCHQHLKADEV